MISYLSHESTTKGNAKCVQFSVFSLTVVFVKFFFCPIEVQPILTYILVLSLILSLVDFHAFDPLRNYML